MTITTDQIEQARNNILPTGVALAVTGTADGAEQALYREGDEIVCYKQTVNSDGSTTRVETRRTPINAEIAAKLCAAFLTRNNR